MSRGVRVCSTPGCGQFRPCPVPGHEPAPWAGSTRKARLPPDWQRRRRRILRRDPICMDCHEAPSAEVDHIDGTDDHSDANLQGLCHPCHLSKTLREAQDARNRSTS